jgi:hypothetical protein
MNRTQRRLLDAAARLLDAPAEELTIIVARGQVEIVYPEPAPLPPGQLPEGLGAYDAAIIGALTSNPVTATKLARLSGHRPNSYYRERLAALVERGFIRRVRRGYCRP